MDTREKQPSEIYDYYIEGEDYFSEIEESDYIVDVQVTKDVTTVPDLEIGPGTFPAVVLIGTNPIDFKVWLGGGLDGSTYKLTCLVTTQVGRKEEFEFKLKVKEK